MEFVEGERLELKRKVNEKICKAVIAFANTLGGRIIVGIDDIGRVIGVSDVDAEMLKVSNLIKDRICPEMLQFVDITPFEIEGKNLICIDVEPGDEKPYYLANKGLCPSGVYMRLGPANVPVDRRGIRKMIRDTDCDVFETRHAKNQNLTFNEAKRIFTYYNVDFDETHYRALGLYADDGFFSNLALLISDQNPYTIRLGAFNDDAFTQFSDRKECTGSILLQYETAFEFLMAHNNLRDYFPAVQRIEKLDYPREAIREGILNCLIHRDYDDRGPTIIKVNRTAMQFVSRGGVEGLTLEEALSGKSNSRNQNLQLLFYRLRIVEAYGTGLKKIQELYEPEELEPNFYSSENIFSLTLPNTNTTRNPNLSPLGNKGPDLRGGEEAYAELYESGALPPDVAKAYEDWAERPYSMVSRIEDNDRIKKAAASIRIESFERLPSITVDGLTVERTLIKLATDNGGAFTRQEAEEALDAGRDVALKVINGMLESGQLVKEGKARATRYRLAM